MSSSFRKYAGPAVSFIATAGLQLSGVVNPLLATVLLVVASIWAGWAVWTSEKVREARDRWIRKTTNALSSVKRRAGRHNRNLETHRQLERERDQALRNLAECRRSFGLSRLKWFAYQFRANPEKAAMLDGRDLQNSHVTVRFVPLYGDDYTLVEEIKQILEQCTGWPVEINGTNNPIIKPNDKFRVIFESSFLQTFSEVASAFREGELIKGQIGFRFAERADHEHLIVEVPPRAIKP